MMSLLMAMAGRQRRSTTSPATASNPAPRGLTSAALKPGTYAEHDPDRIAVIEHPSGRTVTYRDLEDRSARLAGLGAHVACGPATTLPCSSTTRPSTSRSRWAAQRSGLYLTPVNWHLGADEAGYIVADCGARALVDAARFADVLDELDRHGGEGADPLSSTATVDGWEPYDAAVAGGARSTRPTRSRASDVLFVRHDGAAEGHQATAASATRSAPASCSTPMLTMLFGFREEMSTCARRRCTTPRRWAGRSERSGRAARSCSWSVRRRRGAAGDRARTRSPTCSSCRRTSSAC